MPRRKVNRVRGLEVLEVRVVKKGPMANGTFEQKAGASEE